MPFSLPYALPSALPGSGGAPTPVDTTRSDLGGSAGTLHELTSHCASARGLLIAQYQDSPRLQALICSYVDRVQEIESGLVSLYQIGLDVATASGAMLDRLGALVGEARDGRADEAYRRGVRTRVLVNRSQGRVRDLAQIVRVFEGLDPGVVRVREHQPARVIVWISADPVNPPAEIQRRLVRAKAAGVALQSVTQPDTPTGRIFVLGRTADKANTTTGLGWTGDTRGGYLGHALA